jgi:hypothetical protein
VLLWLHSGFTAIALWWVVILSIMPHVHSVAARCRRRERAVALGFVEPRGGLETAFVKSTSASSGDEKVHWPPNKELRWSDAVSSDEEANPFCAPSFAPSQSAADRPVTDVGAAQSAQLSAKGADVRQVEILSAVLGELESLKANSAKKIEHLKSVCADVLKELAVRVEKAMETADLAESLARKCYKKYDRLDKDLSKVEDLVGCPGDTFPTAECKACLNFGSLCEAQNRSIAMLHTIIESQAWQYTSSLNPVAVAFIPGGAQDGTAGRNCCHDNGCQTDESAHSESCAHFVAPGDEQTSLTDCPVSRLVVSQFEPVTFPSIRFPEPASRPRPRLRFSARDLGVNSSLLVTAATTKLSSGIPNVSSQAMVIEECLSSTDANTQFDLAPAIVPAPDEMPSCEGAPADTYRSDCESAVSFLESSSVAQAFAQSHGHLGPDSNAKQWCVALNYLVTLFPNSSSLDKAYVYNLLEDLANQMRQIFPKWINGTNALERKLLRKLSEFDGIAGAEPAKYPAALCGASDSTSSTSVSGVCACDIHTYNIPTEADTASSSSHVSHLNHSQ